MDKIIIIRYDKYIVHRFVDNVKIYNEIIQIIL